MNNAQPVYDTATTYRIEVQGRVDVEWLQRFDSPAEIIFLEIEPMGDTTTLNVHTDQAGMVRQVNRLHGLGITILQLQIVS